MMIEYLLFCSWVTIGVLIVFLVSGALKIKRLEELNETYFEKYQSSVSVGDYWQSKYREQVNNRHRTRDPKTGRFVSKASKCLG